MLSAKEIRALKEEKLFRLEHEKFRYYVPNGKCEEFIKVIGIGKVFIVFFSAANGVGKTAAGANVVAHILFGKISSNPYFNYPLFKDFPFPKRGRLVSDPTNVEKNLIPALKEWLPLGRYTSSKGSKHYDSIIKTGDFELDVMTYEQDPKEFEGSTLGFAWFDEPPPQSIFKATVARMRKGGIIFITATPLAGSGWLYDSFVSTDVNGSGKTLEELEVSKNNVVHIEADVEAACVQHGIRGHLQHTDIEKMTSVYTEDEKWARIQGKFAHLIGMRFKKFSRNIHVIKPFPINLEDFTVYESLDPHPRNNDACVWIAVDRQGRKFIVDELWEKCAGGTKELAQRIKNKASQYRVERRVIDPSAFIEDQHTQQSLQRNLSGLGLTYFEASKLRTASDVRIEDSLTYTRIENSNEFLKSPELFIFDTCHRTIFEFEHYRWDEWSGRGADNKDRKEKTVDKDDHFIEAIGRLLIMEIQFREMPMQFGIENVMEEYDPYK